MGERQRKKQADPSSGTGALCYACIHGWTAGNPALRQLVPKGVVLTLIKEFPQLEMICNVRCDTALYDLPAPRTGKRGRPRIRGERLELRDIQLTKPEGSKYYLGNRKVITNLWKGQPVYLYVTASAPEKESSYRLFICTKNPDDIRTGSELESSKKLREYRQWGMRTA